MRPRTALLALGVMAAGLVVAACAPSTKPLEDKVGALTQDVTSLQQNLQGVTAKAGKIGVPSGDRLFFVTGAELKGSTSTTSLGVPPVDPKTLSDGYRYKKPGDADKADATKWEVSTYVWSPGDMVMLQGDKATLKVFIINGDKHTVHVMDPGGTDVVKEIVMNRGREYTVTFTAAQSGLYKLLCDEHDPTMTATILALPRA